MKKRIILASIAAVSTLGIAGTSALAVAGSGTEGTLIDKLTTKFNLNKDEVEAVFDEARDEAQADRQAEYSERLQEKVDDGDITAEQKTLIEEKQEQLKNEREATRDSLEQWAEDNDLDLQDVLPMGRGGLGRGDMMR